MKARGDVHLHFFLILTYAMRMKRILGIETSCDDTGVGVIEAHDDGSVVVRSNVIATQDHRSTGGVVPERAARRHADAIMSTIEKALAEAGVTLNDMDAIAVTYGPGLAPCLLVGVETARTLAVATGIPVYATHHMHAHIASTFVEHPHVEFPAVVLLASGGHTLLVHMPSRSEYRLLGGTRDDAAGEAFDKIAKMLGLAYPGGPEIARVAEDGNPRAYRFPRPMSADGSFDFSFAGLKTAVLYQVQKLEPLTAQTRADIAASAQEAIVDVLARKAQAAVEHVAARSLILGGGVSANHALRERLREVAIHTGAQLLVPSPGLFTDNGVMIAVCAAPRALRDERSDVEHMRISPVLPTA